MFLIALGSNTALGASSPREILERALAALPGHGLSVVARSGWHRSTAWPPGAGPPFVNAAAVLEGRAAPAEALAALHRVEAALGRRRTRRWEPRSCDLDLLAAGAEILPDRATVAAWMALDPDEQARRAPAELVLPHPRLHERAFVLVPLAEVAPGWVHPVLGRDVRALLADLPPAARAEIARI